MKTMTIRNIPDNVAGQLKVLAKASGASVNATAVRILKSGALPGKAPRKRRDLSRFCGTWSQKEYDDFQRAISDCEQINPEDWR